LLQSFDWPKPLHYVPSASNRICIRRILTQNFLTSFVTSLFEINWVTWKDDWFGIIFISSDPLRGNLRVSGHIIIIIIITFTVLNVDVMVIKNDCAHADFLCTEESIVMMFCYLSYRTTCNLYTQFVVLYVLVWVCMCVLFIWLYQTFFTICVC